MNFINFRDGHTRQHAVFALVAFKGDDLRVITTEEWEESTYLNPSLDPQLPKYSGNFYDAYAFLQSHGCEIEGDPGDFDLGEELILLNDWWNRAHITVTHLIDGDQTSYGYKHNVEDWVRKHRGVPRHPYVSNMAMKMFLAFKGLRIRIDKSNKGNLMANIRVDVH